MTIEYIMQPIKPIIDFLRNYPIHLGEFSFTFMDMFVWSVLASVVIWFIFKLMDN